VAHAVAGGAGAIGATTLAQQCKDMEKAARGGMLVDADEQYSALKAEFELVEARLIEVT
jgi:HPt (histidine-containing phosphotransfer) domain-containing protein